MRRLFSASGSEAQNLGFDFGSDAIGLVRGVARDELVGTRAAVINLDYRFPLKRIERGIGTLPAFARVLHGAVFVDAGHAWVDRFQWSAVTVSLGGELSLDTVLGYVLPVTFTTGAAWVSQDRGFRGVRQSRPRVLGLWSSGHRFGQPRRCAKTLRRTPKPQRKQDDSSACSAISAVTGFWQ